MRSKEYQAFLDAWRDSVYTSNMDNKIIFKASWFAALKWQEDQCKEIDDYFKSHRISIDEPKGPE